MAIRELDYTQPMHALFVRTPVALMRRIDQYALAQGMRTRKAAIMALLELALDQVEHQHETA